MRIRHRLRLVLIATSLAVACSGRSVSVRTGSASGAVERVRWLERHASGIATDSRTNDADLADFGRAVGSARVVLLGEATHDDSAAFVLKTRLVRYLHEQKGFNIVALESPLYDALRNWHMTTPGVGQAGNVRSGIVGFYANHQQMQSLFAYIEHERTGRHPVELRGFDSQLNATLSRDSLASDVRALLTRKGVHADSLRDWPLLSTMLPSLVDGTYYRRKPSPSRRAAFLALIDTIVALTNQPDIDRAVPGVTSRFSQDDWRQVLKNLRVFAADAFDTDIADRDVARFNNARDAQLADNVMWLLGGEMSANKLIVWSATLHALHNASSIDMSGSGAKGSARLVTMGQHLRERLGQQIYSAAVLTSSGLRSEAGAGSASTRAQDSEGADLDALWSNTKFGGAFLDLRVNATSSVWINSPLTARAIGHVPYEAQWPQVLDGFFFLRVRAPSAKR